MAIGAIDRDELYKAVEEAVRDLVRVKHIQGSSFVNLPLLYPDGSSVTVRVEPFGVKTPDGPGLRVSDNGFAYREAEAIGAGNSFARTASTVAEDMEINSNRRLLFVDVGVSQLVRAICDVATASWKVADRIYTRAEELEESEIEDNLKERLESIFGRDFVASSEEIMGSSTHTWKVSATVRQKDHLSVFQAVSNFPNSIYRASTAFHDLAALEKPPRLIAVVRDRKRMGSDHLSILSQAGRVIENEQPDSVYRRAVN